MMPNEQLTKMWSGRFREPLNRTFEQRRRSCSRKWRLLPLGAACLLYGCRGKTDTVVRHNSPYNEVFYTVETYHGRGATDDDYTRIYANLPNKFKLGRLDVLDGEYLEDTQIRWLGPEDVELCMQGGYTNTFRNVVTLFRSDRDSISIHNHLREDCTPQK